MQVVVWSFLLALAACDPEALALHLKDVGFGGKANISDNKTCGSGGATGGGGGGTGGGTGGGSGTKPDPCSDCLKTCKGLPGCCTGSGCMCADECGVKSCTQPYTLCCGPYGDCICTKDCPY